MPTDDNPASAPPSPAEGVLGALARHAERTDIDEVLAKMSETRRERYQNPPDLPEGTVRFEWMPESAAALYHWTDNCDVGGAIPWVITTRPRAEALGGDACPECYPETPAAAHVHIEEYDEGRVMRDDQS
jgi:hypothetical protein